MYDRIIEGLITFSIQNTASFKHVGVGQDANHPRGSGRYPKGSGGRPYQHDKRARDQYLKAKHASSGSSQKRSSPVSGAKQTSTKEIFSKCYEFGSIPKANPDKEMARMKRAAEIGLEASIRTDKNLGYTSYRNWDGSIDENMMEHFIYEGDYAFPMLADLIAQGYSAKQCKAMVKEYSKPSKDGDTSTQRRALMDVSSYKNLDAYIDNCEKVYRERVANSKKEASNYG